MLYCLALLVRVAVDVGAEPNITAMREQIVAACAKSACFKHSNATMSVKNSTDCHGRLTAYEFSLSLIPARSPQVINLRPESICLRLPRPSAADDFRA